MVNDNIQAGRRNRPRDAAGSLLVIMEVSALTRRRLRLCRCKPIRPVQPVPNPGLGQSESDPLDRADIGSHRLGRLVRQIDEHASAIAGIGGAHENTLVRQSLDPP